MVRLPVGVSAPPGAAFLGIVFEGSIFVGHPPTKMRLFLTKDFGDARPMQVGYLADLAESQSGFSRLLKTLAPSLAGLLMLVASALER